jgi:hypothetical protein
MKVPVTAMGFALVVLGKIVFGYFHAARIKRASESTSIHPSDKIILRYAFWCYTYPLLCLFGCIVIGSDMATQTSAFRYKFDLIFFLLVLLGGLFLLYQQMTATVVIFENKLTYREGSSSCEIPASEVRSFAFDGLSFTIERKRGETIVLPATFKSGEFIYAFLKQAASDMTTVTSDSD